MSSPDFSQMSMLDLFRLETENQVQVLTAGLLVLEQNATAKVELEACMRAAHSLKGAARIVNLKVCVAITHLMEDCFVAAQQGRIVLGQCQFDCLLQGVDFLSRIAQTPEAELGQWDRQRKSEADAFLARLQAVLAGELEGRADNTDAVLGENQETTAVTTEPSADVQAADAPAPAPKATDRVLRVAAENLNRLLGLAGESLVESRWLKPFAESMLRLKRHQQESGKLMGSLHTALAESNVDDSVRMLLTEAQGQVLESQQFLAQRLDELQLYDRRSTELSHRLYEEVLACRMRPFADGVQAFPRMVRDLGRMLGKQVRLEISGLDTQVDRDILERLDAPLGHLLRNAVDHGIETPEMRRAVGKPEEGIVQLEARHSAGMLQIIIADNGRGIDIAALRETVVTRQLTSAETAARLSENELLEFLFLPGFTLKDEVTEISGRGVGLDVVQDMVKHVRGTVRVSSQPGLGTRFQLQLPLTLSVVRTLLVDIQGEPYAFPLAYIVRTLKLPKLAVEQLEGRQHFSFEERQIGLVAAHQILARGGVVPHDELCVVVVGAHGHRYGLVVDGFLGERELVVHPLDPRLGKIKDIAAGALMEDGAPVLIVDVEDLVRSVEKLIAQGGLDKVQAPGAATETRRRKRVLIVDDSLTVRELERKLLEQRGYDVDVAVDGMDGWNAVRTGHFDLIVTDIDMPRMDGIELVSLIKRDAHVKSLPVMIVSYKDRTEDRARGLEAGADYYLTKGSFHDESLLDAVVDLIGEAGA